MAYPPQPGFGPAPQGVLGMPRVPWSQNAMVTALGSSLLAGNGTLGGAAPYLAQTMPAAMAANTAFRRDAMGRQEAEARRRQMNEVMKAWPGLTPEQRALFMAQPELFSQYAMQTMQPTETYRPLIDPAERARFGIPETDKAPYQVGPDNKVSAIGGGGTSVNIDNIGTVPVGYEVFRDPETGATRMRPIPGGPADTSKQDTARADQQSRYGDVVLEDIRRAKKKVADQTWFAPVTGIGGQVLKNVGGSAAADTAELISTIESSVAFDRLQAMREAAPTGGALGAITERELAMLKATLGSVSQAQSREQLLYNLDRLESLYEAVMSKAAAYPNAAEYGFGGGGMPADAEQPTIMEWSPDGGLRPAQ